MTSAEGAGRCSKSKQTTGFIAWESGVEFLTEVLALFGYARRGAGGSSLAAAGSTPGVATDGLCDFGKVT